MSPDVKAEVLRLRSEGRYRNEIRAETGLIERELSESLVDLCHDGRVARRGPGVNKQPGREKPQRILSDDRARELHKAYRSREPIKRLAADAYVSVTFLYGRFRALGLPTSVNDQSACERALRDAHEAAGGANLSWHGYQALRREHPHWPCASTVERVLGGGSWTAAKRAAGLLPLRAVGKASDVNPEGLGVRGTPHVA